MQLILGPPQPLRQGSATSHLLHVSGGVWDWGLPHLDHKKRLEIMAITASDNLFSVPTDGMPAPSPAEMPKRYKLEKQLLSPTFEMQHVVSDGDVGALRKEKPL